MVFAVLGDEGHHVSRGVVALVLEEGGMSESSTGRSMPVKLARPIGPERVLSRLPHSGYARAVRFATAMSRILPSVGRVLASIGKWVLILLVFGSVIILFVLLDFAGHEALPDFLAALVIPFAWALAALFGGRWLARCDPARIASIGWPWWSGAGLLLVAVVAIWLLTRPPDWDGGQWHLQESPTDTWLSEIAGTPDGSKLWIVGGSGTLLHSTDFGKRWTPQRTGGDYHYSSIAVGPEGNRLWVYGWKDHWEAGRHITGSTVFYSEDGGRAWTEPKFEFEGRLGRIRATPDFRWLWFRSDDRTDERPEKFAYQRSSDGGKTWSPLRLEGREYFGSLYMDDHDETMLLRAENDMLMRSENGGRSWSTWTHRWSHFKWGQNRMLFGVYGVSGVDDLWMTGHMEILHSTDRGRSWEVQKRSQWPSDIAGSADGSVLWAVGDRGTILHGTRGSDTWKLQPSPTDVELDSVFVTADGSHAWAVGKHGVIVHVER